MNSDVQAKFREAMQIIKLWNRDSNGNIHNKTEILEEMVAMLEESTNPEEDPALAKIKLEELRLSTV